MTDDDLPYQKPPKAGDEDRSDSGFDSSPDRFRRTHSSDRFSGASGVLFEQAMAQTRMAICLCDPRDDDVPIVFANRAFRDLTGYDEDEIVGRNCRFLQGEDTSEASVAKLRRAIEQEDVIVVELLNYRKDGTPFWNALHIGPIYDNEGNLIYFFGSQWDVSEVHAARTEERHALAMARELSHRTKNMFAIISGIVNVTGRANDASEIAGQINERIRALARAYDTTLEDASIGRIALGPAVDSILAPFKDRADLTIEGERVAVSFSHVSMLGLVLHELATASAQTGALTTSDGKIDVVWKRIGEGELELRWCERPVPEAPDGPMLSAQAAEIVQRLLKVSHGEMTQETTADGYEALIRLPIGEG